MCRVCDQVKSLGRDAALKLIGEAVGRGKSPEHFKKLLDQVLGTEEPEDNPDGDEAWEGSYRGRG